MFTDVHLKNFAAFSDFHWSGHGQINVVVGENDTGKSHLLKELYAIAKTVETNAARNDGGSQASAQIAFSSKLRWTFQPPKLDALITNGSKSLRIEAQLAGKSYGCGSSSTRRIPCNIDHLTRLKRGLGAGSGSGITAPS